MHPSFCVSNLFDKLTKVNSFVRLTEILKSDIIDARK